MIHLKQNIKQEDAQWVLEFVVPKQGYRIDRTTLGYLADAHNRIFEEQVGVDGCSCNFKAQHGMWYGRINQYDPELKAIAYPPVVEKTPKPTRKKK